MSIGTPSGGAKTRDPVCGMEIDEFTTAGVSEYEGNYYYFCSLQCKEKFDAEPGRYVEEMRRAS